MNLGEFAIKKNVVTWAITLVLLVAGVVSFNKLARLEDPEFTIKSAIVTTPYPGASAEEVEKEVSDVIERAVQELGQLKRVESHSTRGMSSIKATTLDKYDKDGLPQVWDELRRKVNDYQTRLPPGAGPSIVNDDFGDVYGVYAVLTGDGYTMAELNEVAKLYRRELLLVQDVKRVVLWGVQPETVLVEMARAKMAALGVSQDDIYNALSAKNLPADAGHWKLGPDYIPIVPSGEYDSEREFAELLIGSREGRLVYLGDVATIRRSYEDPPKQIMRYNGQPGIALGISTVQGGNVVTMGTALGKKLRALESQIPAGMEMGVVALQSAAVTESIESFVVNLLEAVAIVVVVLLFFMGLRSGLIIGFILLLTISGTFLLMKMQGVMLERISLGALIIALGMLVDNAIVIVEGMKIKIEGGIDRLQAAKEVVGQQATPLFGATVVAILAFAAIGTSQDATGEYCRSLFIVIMFALGLSWFTAMTTTPLVSYLFLKGKPEEKGEDKDPYGGMLFRVYRGFLTFCLRRRWLVIVVVLGLFASSLVAFGSLKQMFFPNSTRPQFYIEFYFPQGTHIRETEAGLEQVENYLMELDGVTDVATAVGGGDLRFLLTYEPGRASSNYGAVFADVDDWTKIDGLLPEIEAHLQEMLPEATPAIKKFRLGPGEGARIQLRISGPDRTRLRQMGEQVKQIMLEENAIAVRDEWQEQVRVIEPRLAEAQARKLGLDRPDVARALQSAFDGTKTGVFREGDELLSIIARAPEIERQTVDNMRELQIWSPVAQRMVPLRQVLLDFGTRYEEGTIFRWNRTTTMRLHCEPYFTELPSELLARLKPRIEKELGVDLATYHDKSYPAGKDPLADLTAATLPVKDADQIPLLGQPGYFIAWGGEAEDSSRAQASLAASIPIFVGIMVLAVVFLFNAVRQPLIIWLTVPLAAIGVAFGLLIFKQPFGFMALLGALSLSGMLIKNSIVLIDEIDTQIRSGKEHFLAVVDSGVSRMRPVMMAAATTILGMIPLLTDAFFVAMAVTVMAGLFVATILTLVVVPVLYVILFRIPYSQAA